MRIIAAVQQRVKDNGDDKISRNGQAHAKAVDIEAATDAPENTKRKGVRRRQTSNRPLIDARL